MDYQLEDYRPGLEPDYDEDEQLTEAECFEADIANEVNEAVLEHGVFGATVYKSEERARVAQNLGAMTDDEFGVYWAELQKAFASRACLDCGRIDDEGYDDDCTCNGEKRTECVDDTPRRFLARTGECFEAVTPQWFEANGFEEAV